MQLCANAVAQHNTLHEHAVCVAAGLGLRNFNVCLLQDLLPGCLFVKDIQSGYQEVCALCASDPMYTYTNPLHPQLLPPECPDASALQLFLQCAWWRVIQTQGVAAGHCFCCVCPFRHPA